MISKADALEGPGLSSGVGHQGGNRRGKQPASPAPALRFPAAKQLPRRPGPASAPGRGQQRPAKAELPGRRAGEESRCSPQVDGGNRGPGQAGAAPLGTPRRPPPAGPLPLLRPHGPEHSSWASAPWGQPAEAVPLTVRRALSNQGHQCRPSSASLPQLPLCPRKLRLEILPTISQPIPAGHSGFPALRWAIFHPLGVGQRPWPSFGSSHGHRVCTSHLPKAPSCILLPFCFLLLISAHYCIAPSSPPAGPAPVLVPTL